MAFLLVGTALVAGTGLLLATRLAEGSITQLLIGAYVISFSEVILLSLLLSVASLYTRGAFLTAAVVLCAAAIAIAYPIRITPFPRKSFFLSVMRDPVLVVIGAVVLGVVAYSLALALFLPANDQDALEYHLARGAFWKQQGGIAYIPGAEDARLNGFPPNGEIAMSFTMLTSRSGQFAPLVQLTAALATALAVYGISRRVGLGVREGLFGGMLFVTLPAVTLQASTGLNDIIVASFIASAAFFLLRPTSINLALAGASVALLTGTKLIGLVALPGLGLVALTARRNGRRAVLSALGVSAGLGCYWYVLNLAKTGDFFGGISSEAVTPDPVAAIARTIRLALDTVELPGAVGLDRLFYVAAAGLLALGVYLRPGRAGERRTQAAIAGGLTLAPLALVPLAHLLVRGSQKLFFELGRADVGYLDSSRSATKASPVFSWYGPVGVLLTVSSCVLVLHAVHRRRLPPVLLVLAAAPALWVVCIGLVIPYFEWNGRFAMGGFALASATWGLLLRVRPLAWATGALAVLTVFLAFIHLHDRPSGVRLIEPVSEHSVWDQPQWIVQGTDHPDLHAVFRFAEQHIPSHARLALQPNVFPSKHGKFVPGVPPFPFFGSHLSRSILFADSASVARVEQAGWAILYQKDQQRCFPGWSRAFSYGAWVILRRASGRSCG
jgi:hypothetical protein